MPDVSPDSTVSYTVKELLDEQTTILREVDRKLDGKADKADLVALSSTINENVIPRIDRLEEHRDSIVLAQSFRRRAWAVAGTISGVAAVIAAAFITAGHL